MAEQQGFFRRIFSFGQAQEADRSAQSENLVAEADVAVRTPPSPDADQHFPAAAPLDADTEAGADASAPETGGIEPLNPSAPPEAGATTEKKTPNS